MDNLLNFLLIEKRVDVVKLKLLPQVEELKKVNEQMHQLIEGRVAERESKMFGAFEFARKQTEACYHDFITFVNAWALVNEERLQTDAKDLAEFISWLNATIEVYKQKVLHIPVNTPAAGEADKDPDAPTILLPKID